MRISDWSSDVCSSDLGWRRFSARPACGRAIRPKSPSFVETPPELEQRVALDDINRADVEILQRELAVAGADEATELEAEMVEHRAYPEILALGQRHLDQMIAPGAAFEIGVDRAIEDDVRGDGESVVLEKSGSVRV